MQLWQLSSFQIREGIREGEFSSVDVMQDHFRRIELVNPSLNAVVRTLEDTALAAAAIADGLRSNTPFDSLPPLLGVPFSIKENLSLIGTPTTNGIPAYADNYPVSDSAVVKLMKGAGAIPIARTNLPDLALRWDTSSTLYGRTLNPWDSSVTAGGSSGGEAAAIASGMSPLGLGNDYFGSLRFPAWACGICSLKPGGGRVPGGKYSGPMAVTFQAWVSNGPMARTVEDLKLALGVLSHPDPRDPDSQPAPGITDLDPQNTVVAIVEHPSPHSTDLGSLKAVNAAARALEQAGYGVEYATPPAIEAIWTSRLKVQGYDFGELASSDIASVVGADVMRFLEYFGPNHGKGPSAYFEGFNEILSFRQDWSMFMDRYPLILGPVCTRRQFTADADVQGRESILEIIESLLLTTAVNSMELPAVSLPVGVENGLPQGVQVIGRRMKEEHCLEAAAVIEAALGTITPIDPRQPS